MTEFSVEALFPTKVSIFLTKTFFLNEQELNFFLRFIGRDCIKNGIAYLGDNFSEIITENDLKNFFYCIRNKNNPEFNKEIELFMQKNIENEVADILLGLSYKNNDKKFLSGSYGDENISIPTETIFLELSIFEVSTSKIQFINSYIYYDNITGIIIFPTFLKIDKLYSTIFFSNIYFKSEKIKKLCKFSEYRPDWCNVIIKTIKKRLIFFLEKQYCQKFSK
jgi:hypothetical protein